MQRQYHIFESLDSTHEWAKRHLTTCARDKLTLVNAVYQTHGKGTHGRSWQAPPNLNLLLTFVFFIQEEDNPLRLTHLLGIALCTWLHQQGVEAHIKWPNDIHVHGKKLAGILCETQQLDGQTAIILSIGLNVNMQEMSHINQPATSLLLETGHTWEINQILQVVSDRFHDHLEVYKKSGFTPYLDSEIKVVRMKDQGSLLN